MKNYVLKKWYKGKDHRKLTYPEDVDKELVPMLDVFNNLPGVRTAYSCCGHGGDSWYLVMYFTSDFMKNVVLNYFGKTVDVSKEDEWFQRVQTTLDFELMYDDEPKCWNTIPEKEVAIYCKELGKLPEKKRKKEYAKICEFFASFSPRYDWAKVHEF